MDFQKLPVFIHPTELCFNVAEKSSQKQILTVYNPYDLPIKFKIRSTNPKQYSVNEAEGVIDCRGIVDIAIRHLEVTEENVNARDKFRVQFFENESTHSPPRLIGQKEFSSTVVRHSGSSLSGAFLSSHATVPASKDSGNQRDHLPSVEQQSIARSSNLLAERGREKDPTPCKCSSKNSTYQTAPGIVRDKRTPTPPSTLSVAVALLCVVALLMPIAPSSYQDHSGIDTPTEAMPFSHSALNIFSLSLVPSFLHVSLNQKLIAAFTLGLLTMAMLQNA